MVDRFRVAPGTKVRLDRWDTKWNVPASLELVNKDELKREADEFIKQRVQELAELQDVFWADGRYSLLVIVQGSDASGKDSIIKHVTSGMTPAGVTVISFIEPVARGASAQLPLALRQGATGTGRYRNLQPLVLRRGVCRAREPS